jgi:hypothetical protein
MKSRKQAPAPSQQQRWIDRIHQAGQGLEKDQQTGAPKKPARKGKSGGQPAA